MTSAQKREIKALTEQLKLKISSTKFVICVGNETLEKKVDVIDANTTYIVLTI